MCPNIVSTLLIDRIVSRPECLLRTTIGARIQYLSNARGRPPARVRARRLEGSTDPPPQDFTRHQREGHNPVI